MKGEKKLAKQKLIFDQLSTQRTLPKQVSRIEEKRSLCCPGCLLPAYLCTGLGVRATAAPCAELGCLLASGLVHRAGLLQLCKQGLSQQRLGCVPRAGPASPSSRCQPPGLLREAGLLPTSGPICRLLTTPSVSNYKISQEF